MDSGGLVEERERLLYYKDAIARAEVEYRKNNENAEALTQWGVGLFEIAHFHQGAEALDLIHEAVQKLEMALAINPRKHDTLWFLGNALTSQGFLYPDTDKAMAFFKKAEECYKRAVDEEPNNEIYARSLQLTKKAPELHKDVQRQLAAQAAAQKSANESAKVAAAQRAGRRAGEGQNADSDFFFDLGGWIILGALATGWVALARHALQ